MRLCERSVEKFEFSQRLKRARVDKKLSKTDLAMLVGVSRNTYTRWENHASTGMPNDINYILRLCLALKMNFHYLTTGTNESEQDARYISRIDAFYHRNSSDSNFNALIERLQNADNDVIEAINTLLQFTTGEHKINKITRNRSNIKGLDDLP